MSLDRDIQLLRGVPLFEVLGPDQLRLLAFGSVRRHLVTGTVLFEKGDAANSAFVVAAGSIRMTGVAAKGEPQEMVLSEAGAMIGELALFIETERSATATAESRSEILEITRSLMSRMLEEYPQLALHFRQHLAARLTATLAEMEQVRAAYLADEPTGS